MLIKTKGIVLNHFSYSETSIVVHIYTQALGKRSFLVHSVRSPKKKQLLPLLQPLTLVDLDIYHKPKQELHHLKEMKLTWPFRTIPFHPVRRAMAFFFTELISKSIKEEESNPELFNFLLHSIQALDEGIPGEYNFHLYFMLQLTRFLGFFPEKYQPGACCFDLTDGRYALVAPHHAQVISGKDLETWNQLQTINLSSLPNLPWNVNHRQALLSHLENYFTLHLPGFGHLHSLQVLHQLFRPVDQEK